MHSKQKPANGNQSFMPRQFRNSHGIKIVKLLQFKKNKKQILVHSLAFFSLKYQTTTKSYITGDESNQFVFSQLGLICYRSFKGCRWLDHGCSPPTKLEEDKPLLCPAPSHTKLISSQGTLPLAEFVTQLAFPFSPTIQKKKEKKYIYIHIMWESTVCILRRWNLPARSVTDNNIPKEVQGWKRRISGHFMGSPGKRSLLFPTPIIPLLWKDLGASVKLDASQQAPWDQLLCRTSWPQPLYKGSTRPGPVWVIISTLPLPDASSLASNCTERGSDC